MGIAGTEQPVCLVSVQNKLSLSCDFIDNLGEAVVCAFNHFVSPGLTLYYLHSKHASVFLCCLGKSSLATTALRST